MARLGLERTIVDAKVYERTLDRFREAGVVLPTLGQLKDPATIPAAIRARLADVEGCVPAHPALDLRHSPSSWSVQVVRDLRDDHVLAEERRALDQCFATNSGSRW